MLNFLEEQLITAASADGQKSRYSLPGVMGGLVRGQIASFPSLRTHQRHVWHAFLVQIATLALERAGKGSPPDSEAGWRQLLRALTPQWPGGEPWSLAIADARQPAILQAPIPGKDLSDFRVVETPDKLDMLVTSKNHDLKAERMIKNAPEDWLFALVSLQTQDGIMGAGKYGVSRMNGGYGSRPMFGIDLAGSPGFRFRRDVAMLLSPNEDYNPNGLCRNGLALLWLIPWDGSKTIAFKGVHPLYIEICRRVRLKLAGDRIFAMETGSTAPRISGAAELKGNTGDPWTPISAEGKAFSVSREGFSYRKLADLLDPAKFRLPPLARLFGSDPVEGAELVAESICRGQGKTEGYHERRIPIPKNALNIIASSQSAASMLADKRAAALSEIRTALRSGLFVLSQGGADRTSAGKEAAKKFAEPWLERFERAADRSFLNELWDEASASECAREDIYIKWLKAQLSFAQGLLSEAFQAFPYPAARRYHARAQAGIAFRARLAKSPLIHPNFDWQKSEEALRAAH
jgi:CRISPR system Cascade subunit CasA